MNLRIFWLLSILNSCLLGALLAPTAIAAPLRFDVTGTFAPDNLFNLESFSGFYVYDPDERQPSSLGGEAIALTDYRFTLVGGQRNINLAIDDPIELPPSFVRFQQVDRGTTLYWLDIARPNAAFNLQFFAANALPTVPSGPDYGAPPTRFLQGSFAAALVPGNATVTSARVTAAQSVPEPTGALGWLALGGLVLGWRRLRPQS